MIVVAVTAAGWWWFGGQGASPAPRIQPAVETAVRDTGVDTITVHVSGAVVRPGLVTVPTDARVADALVAAGGATPDAALADVNLAAPIGDGVRVVIPQQSSGGVSAPGSETMPSDTRVRINAATLEELMRLPGVGRVLAERILEHRSSHGPFAAVEDLLDVHGIGEGRLAALRDAVVVP